MKFVFHKIDFARGTPGLSPMALGKSRSRSSKNSVLMMAADDCLDLRSHRSQRWICSGRVPSWSLLVR